MVVCQPAEENKPKVTITADDLGTIISAAVSAGVSAAVISSSKPDKRGCSCSGCNPPAEACSKKVPMAAFAEEPPLAMSPTAQNKKVSLPEDVDSIEEWAKKLITYGQKHRNKTFGMVFSDKDYVEWVKARSKTASDGMRDFISFCLYCDQQGLPACSSKRR
jgi:hypothetical protein